MRVHIQNLEIQIQIDPAVLDFNLQIWNLDFLLLEFYLPGLESNSMSRFLVGSGTASHLGGALTGK